MKRILIIFCWLFSYIHCSAQSFDDYLQKFEEGYRSLQIPNLTLDYKEYFKDVPGIDALNRQEAFFTEFRHRLNGYHKLSANDQLYRDHINYEIEYNLNRVKLEREWVHNGRNIPQNGLHALQNRAAWYSFFIKKFTSLNLSAQDIYELGINEIQRVTKEITSIRNGLGFENENMFYTWLQRDTFYYHDKEQVITRYGWIDSTVRAHLRKFIQETDILPVIPMEWPEANAYTPPGIYLNSNNNAYGKDVFQFNFYEHKHNKRAMEWLYMHEAIPGHHLQSDYRQKYVTSAGFQHLFSYPGNFEGWACYVEYNGKELGLYQDVYSELGKWEWDLVRSVRLVLDVGIHYHGWSREKALAFWKENIKGQDEIAEREIIRITNWPCQALSYKVGACTIEKMKQQAIHLGFTERKFHQRYLEMSYFPLQVIEKYIN